MVSDNAFLFGVTQWRVSVFSIFVHFSQVNSHSIFAGQDSHFAQGRHDLYFVHFGSVISFTRSHCNLFWNSLENFWYAISYWKFSAFSYCQNKVLFKFIFSCAVSDKKILFSSKSFFHSK